MTEILKAKYCPIFSIIYKNEVDCYENLCEFFIKKHFVENDEDTGCSFRILAQSTVKSESQRRREATLRAAEEFAEKKV